MAKKNINERCPLSGECDKKKCEYPFKELDCSYYHSNARPGYELEDQEKRRSEAFKDDASEDIDYPADIIICSEETTALPGLIYIPTESIYPHPDNPRKDLGDLTELAESIKANGILQNLTVIPGHYMTEDEYVKMAVSEGVKKSDAKVNYDPKEWFEADGYTAIIGHRRLAAAKAAGLAEVPCIVAQMSEKEQISTMLTENMQRSDLNIYEQAQGFQMMLDLGDTMDEIAGKSGFSKTTVRRRLEIAKLDEKVMKRVSGRQLTMSDFDELAKIDDLEVRNKVLGSIGTPNFKNELQNALQNQKLIVRMNEWLSVLRTFAEEVDESDYDTMKYVCNYAYYNQDKEVEIPEDAESTRYFIVISDRQISLYKERDLEKEEAEEEERAERRRLSEEEAERWKNINCRHFALRSAFVKGLSNAQLKKRLGMVSTLLANTMYKMSVCQSWNSPKIDTSILAPVLGIEIEAEQLKEIEKFSDVAGIRSAAEAMTEKLLFTLAYSALDCASEGYWKHDWLDGRWQYVHKENTELDWIYAVLSELGYEMSDEEKAMQDGTHEIFRHEEVEQDADM